MCYASGISAYIERRDETNVVEVPLLDALVKAPNFGGLSSRIHR